MQKNKLIRLCGLGSILGVKLEIIVRIPNLQSLVMNRLP
jgi:hypothetical protein